MTALEAQAPTLTTLAVEIEQFHNKANDAMMSLVEYMVLCGERLLEARKQVEQGGWNAWVERNLTMHPKTARDYMKFAIHADVLREHRPDSRVAAKRLLQRLDLPRLNASDEHRAEAARMKKDGMTQHQIAEHFHVTPARVSQWLNPERAKMLDRRRQAQAAVAKRLLEQKQKAAAVKKGPKDLSLAYGHLRKAIEAMDRTEGANTEARRAITRAQDALYRAEDAIVEASKAS